MTIDDDPKTNLLRFAPLASDTLTTPPEAFDKSLMMQAGQGLHLQANCNIAAYRNAVEQGDSEVSYRESPELESLSKPLVDALAAHGFAVEEGAGIEMQFEKLYQFLQSLLELD
jgi:hypothetical protein